MKRLLILLLFPLMMFAQDSTLVGDVDCSGEVNSQDASLILQFVTNVIDSLPCEANMTGLTPEQLQEMIDMMEDQLSINFNTNGCNSFGDFIDIEIPSSVNGVYDEWYEFESHGFLITQIQGNSQGASAGFQIVSDTLDNDSEQFSFYQSSNNIITTPVKQGQFFRHYGSSGGFVSLKRLIPLECEESTTTPNNNSGSNNKTLMYTIDGF